MAGIVGEGIYFVTDMCIHMYIHVQCISTQAGETEGGREREEERGREGGTEGGREGGREGEEREGREVGRKGEKLHVHCITVSDALETRV